MSSEAYRVSSDVRWQGTGYLFIYAESGWIMPGLSFAGTFPAEAVHGVRKTHLSATRYALLCLHQDRILEA